MTDPIVQAFQHFMSDELPAIVEAEGLAFIKKNFREEGFTDTGLEKWKERKKVDKNGRDITRYRTGRSGEQNSLNRYGRTNEGRALLVGEKSGSNKLRNSFRARRTQTEVEFYTDKEYAEYHNEGTDHIPARPFMDESAYLEAKIKNKINRRLDQIFKNR